MLEGAAKVESQGSLSRISSAILSICSLLCANESFHGFNYMKLRVETNYRYHGSPRTENPVFYPETLEILILSGLRF